MAAGLSWNWDVEIGVNWSVALTKFTSRVIGIQIDQDVELNALANFTAYVTLNNNDGELTPGGGGTYDWDWLSAGVQITFNVTGWSLGGPQYVAAGIVTDFQLYDDGITSVVNLTVSDVWSVAARTAYTSVPSSGSKTIEQYLEAKSTANTFGASFPRFGLSDADLDVTDLSLEVGPNINTTNTLSARTLADLINNTVLPGVNAWLWPTYLLKSGSKILVKSALVTNLRSDHAQPFEFNSSVGTTLPFVDLQQGWTTDRIINTATITSIAGATAQTATSATSTAKYGSRAVRFTESAARTNAAALTVAQGLANRYDTPRFIPIEITTSVETINDRCSSSIDDILADLFGVEDYFLRKLTLTWTGAGANAQTLDLITLGRTIRATPAGGTQMILRLGYWVDETPWIINTSQLGINRLG